MTRSNRFRSVTTALVALVVLSQLATQASAVLVANVKTDYNPGVNAGDTTAITNPNDTFGTGRWDYFQSNSFGAGGSGTLVLLEWDNTQNPGSGANGRYERAGVNHTGGSQFDFVQISDHGGYSVTGNAAEVFVHPSDTGNNPGGDTRAVIRWTAGAGEVGTGTITGSVRRPANVTSGGQMKIFVNGTELFASGTLSGSSANFAINAPIAVGSVVDFVFDSVADSHFDDSMYLSSRIDISSTPRISIPVPNGSFENPFTTGAVTDITTWVDPSGCCDGTFQSPGFGQGAAPTDGNQIAFMNVQTGSIFQTLTNTFQPGFDYELSVDVSSRDVPGAAQMSMVLYEGTIAGLAGLNAGNIVGQRILGAADGIVADQFGTFTLTVTAAQVAAALASGQQIGIGFFGLNTAGGTTSDFDLDRVLLTQIAAPVPEPATATLGLIAAAGLARRRRR